MRTCISWVSSLASAFIDLILPASALETMTERDFRARAKKAPADGQLPSFVEPLFSYKDPLVRKAIWELKYHGNKKVAKLVAAILYSSIKEAAECERAREPILIIPIPSSRLRLREKGFNQTYLIADAIRCLDVEKKFIIRADILEKYKETKTQVSMGRRKDRLSNLHGAFRIRADETVTGKRCFLVDDVTTTGATFSEAKKTLSAAGAKTVQAFAIAH